jgi:pimeloyl-ACP methyl ester carboxylesterase
MRVEYKVEGSGPPIVYVCGLEGSGRLFYKQSEDLARDHRIITMPLRGEGRYEMPRLVEDLRGSCATRARRATVLGESFGGLLTMATALAHPELFARMILLNTFPHFSERAKIRMGCILFAAFYPMMKAHRTRAARHVLFSPDIAEEDRQLFRDYTRVVGREGYVSRMRIIRDTDLRPRLGRDKDARARRRGHGRPAARQREGRAADGLAHAARATQAARRHGPRRPALGARARARMARGVRRVLTLLV